ncbi:pathogenesis-related protein 5-like [Durio zibethinus]|uniref:Pathogenesis-related protein 5-like n=1 Tax=Durio zibethinus TaxID=66656 RepID=A0A6P5XEN6_DURZI|nr:pathogenesis-related protein 5-like [Durio zibethinus]
MAVAHNSSFLLFCIFFILSSGAKKCADAKNFTLVNQCQETVWPAIITVESNFHGEGFALNSGQTFFYNAPDVWSGRIWGRTGCNFDKNGNGTCQTGGCGTSLNCTSAGSLPVSIAEFTLGETDYYDVSLVDGFNLPILIKPGGGKGNCSTAGCDGDLRQHCSSDLAVKNNGKVVGCRSACDAFNNDEYCCRGAYKDPGACLPTNYSKNFKQVCPAASSYAYDNLVSIITCSASDYMVAFCTTRNNTACTYNNQKFVCSITSGGFKVFPQSWRSLMLALPLASILQILF